MGQLLPTAMCDLETSGSGANSQFPKPVSPLTKYILMLFLSQPDSRSEGDFSGDASPFLTQTLVCVTVSSPPGFIVSH